MTQGGAVLSEILAEPGPTHSVFDALAAAADVFANGERIALLGFAGGGILAPLRAMGCASPIDSVDRDMRGARLFGEIAGKWAGEVDVAEGDAVRWLRSQRASYRMIIEDLSELGTEGETKPAITVTALPRLMQSRLRPGGLAVLNLLPVPGVSWRSLQRQVIEPWGRGVVIYLTDFENRIVLTGARVPPARLAGRRISQSLDRIGSKLSVRARSFPRR